MPPESRSNLHYDLHTMQSNFRSMRSQAIAMFYRLVSFVAYIDNLNVFRTIVRPQTVDNETFHWGCQGWVLEHLDAIFEEEIEESWTPDPENLHDVPKVPPPVLTNGQPVYEVERILDRRVQKQHGRGRGLKLQYLRGGPDNACAAAAAGRCAHHLDMAPVVNDVPSTIIPALSDLIILRSSTIHHKEADCAYCPVVQPVGRNHEWPSVTLEVGVKQVFLFATSQPPPKMLDHDVAACLFYAFDGLPNIRRALKLFEIAPKYLPGDPIFINATHCKLPGNANTSEETRREWDPTTTT
ncbi:hypothetical protein FQN57_004166 [Myotisia sp. PD_48]|nr:hypothetical protein FQN57_004166 [Myotisia sp. PD_48]